MLSVGLALGTMSFFAAILVYLKMPRRTRKWIEKHYLFTDFISMILVYVVLGGTLTALIASAWCAILISAALEVAHNKEDYLFLYHFKDQTVKSMGGLKGYLKTINEEYKKRHPHLGEEEEKVV